MSDIFSAKDKAALIKAGLLSPSEKEEANSLIKPDSSPNTPLSIDNQATINCPSQTSLNEEEGVYINLSARVNRKLYKQWREYMGQISLASYLSIKMNEDLK